MLTPILPYLTKWEFWKFVLQSHFLYYSHPGAIRVCFKHLVENLESSDPQVVTSVIGVFCELVVKDPWMYLPLAPEFYRILVHTFYASSTPPVTRSSCSTASASTMPPEPRLLSLYRSPTTSRWTSPVHAQISKTNFFSKVWIFFPSTFLWTLHSWKMVFWGKKWRKDIIGVWKMWRRATAQCVGGL